MGLSANHIIPVDQEWVDEGKKIISEMNPKDAVLFLRDCFSKDSEELVSKIISFIKANKFDRRPLAKRMKAQEEAISGVFNAASKVFGVCQVFDAFAKQMEEGAYRNNHKRWGSADDELLIELVCDGESDVFISNCLGRSVSACKSRVTYLVGIKRISERAAGYFVGTLSGKEISGHIDGRIYKQESEDIK